MKKKTIAFIATILLCHRTFAADTITVTPREDPAALLHNPDTGWVLYENYPLDTRPNGSSTLLTLPNEHFESVDNVAIMFAWSDIEHTEGTYDFSKVDHAYDHWHKLGKSIQLRLSAESLLWWSRNTPPTGLGVPQYVLDKLPTDKKQTRTAEGWDYTVVDAREPYYLDRLKSFLAAVSEHFDKRRTVTLIDLRGFGLWGEWHSGYRYESPAARHAALSTVIDTWSAAFPHHTLALSASYDPDSPKSYYAGPTDHYDEPSTTHYADFLHYSAFDHALTKPNVTFRRDGVGGAVHSNERRLLDQAFATLSKGPISCEFLGGYADAKKGGDKWLRFMLDDALNLHPNYINLLGYQSTDALAFIREQPDLFARGSREMGYRLVPLRIEYPASVCPGETFEIKMRWVNRGAGRAMRDYHATFTLRDENGTDVTTFGAEPLGTSKWIRGNEYEVKSEVRFDRLPPGSYTLVLTLKDDQRAIELPLHDGKNGSYPIGQIACEKNQ